MTTIRSSGNKDTEIKLISLFRSHGITGWRRHQTVLGKPDFVFRREKLAIFVDGCFWHGCPQHGRKPSTNRSYWLPKLRRNQKRDAEVKRALSKAGWIVVRLWEHDLADESRVVHLITKALNQTVSRLQSNRR
ncbi:MAG: mismatch repair protein Vsr [Pedosphaera sp.]|nr:mismatch repair protein Vsr [Pedosphaera sp.]